MIEEEFNKELKKARDKFKKDLNQLSSYLQNITPVDTGFLKGEWDTVKEIDEGHYRLTNNANYASYVLIDGRSQQLPMGVLPHIKVFMEKKLWR